MCWSQFSDRSGHNGIHVWHSGLSHPDAWPLAQQCLHTVHPGTPSHPGVGLQGHSMILHTLILYCVGLGPSSLYRGYYLGLFIVLHSHPFLCNHYLSLGEGWAEPTLWAEGAGSPTGSLKRRGGAGGGGASERPAPHPANCQS